LGYIIAQSVSDNSQPTPLFGITASVGFFRTEDFTDGSFVALSETIAQQSFATAAEAKTWLNDNGYWTSYGLTTPLTITLEGFYFEGSVGAGYQAIANQVLNDDVSISFTNVLGTITGPPLLISGSVVILSGQTSGYTQTFTDYDYNDLTQESSFTGITFNVTGSTEYGFTSEISGSTFDVTPTPTPTNTETPSITLTGETQTPTPTGTPTGTPEAETPTPTPTETEAPTPTPTVTPTGTPEAETPTPTPTGTSVTPTPTPTSGATGDFTVTVSQVGSDVVWNGSGSFNLGSLSLLSTQELTAGFSAPQAIWAIGDATPPGSILDVYGVITTFPTSFGTAGGPIGTPSGSGDTFGILPNGSNRNLLVPTGYTSGSFISGTTTYAGATIAGMNLIPGTYTWAWGSGGTASSLVMTIESAGVTPTPTGTPTGTPVAETPTPTETETPTPTPTNTPTETEVLTPTPTETETPTPTPTGTPTETEELTPTPTETTTPTPTPTSGVTPTGFTITISEVGPDVVMSGEGTFNITDLTLFRSNVGPKTGGVLEIEDATFIMGSLGGFFNEFSGFTSTPNNFGSGTTIGQSLSGGDIVGVLPGALQRLLVLPTGYTSGDYITSFQTFTGQTFSSLGLTTGIYTYTWGSGENSDSMNVIVEEILITPTPTPTETPTPTPTGTPEAETPTPTPTPTGTPEAETPTPTETETPTPTPTGTPEAETPTPTPTGTPLEETPTPTPTPTGT
jgi:hypothetical protein